MSSQNHDYNIRTKEATIVTGTLSKLMTFISNLKDEIINFKEIIVKKFKDDKALLANRVVKLEDKLKNLEIKNNNLDQYNCRSNVEVSIIPEIVSTEVNIFNVIDVKISNWGVICHCFSIKKKMLLFDLQIRNIVYLLFTIGKS